MKNASYKLGAALLALALLVVPALATSHESTVSSHELQISSQKTTLPNQEQPVSSRALQWVMILGSLGIAGAVTVTYKYPVAGTVPPTAAQSSQVQVVKALVEWADSDASAVVTHNFGIATAAGQPGGQPGLDKFFPGVEIYSTAVGTVAAAAAVTLTDGNTVTLTKGSIVGTGGSILVTVHRPQSIGQ